MNNKKLKQIKVGDFFIWNEKEFKAVSFKPDAGGRNQYCIVSKPINQLHVQNLHYIWVTGASIS